MEASESLQNPNQTAHPPPRGTFGPLRKDDRTSPLPHGGPSAHPR